MKSRMHLKVAIFGQEQLKSITRKICKGLKFMANTGVIHCDMKPENILFDNDKYSSVKIIDFGASCEDFTSGFFYVQSRYYRAPEIVIGLPYDHAVDMWSVGCILYEMITGTPLFPAKDENDLMEFFLVTIGEFPNYMLEQCKKYK
jgi:serine/threonine protein kinase